MPLLLPEHEIVAEVDFVSHLVRDKSGNTRIATSEEQEVLYAVMYGVLSVLDAELTDETIETLITTAEIIVGKLLPYCDEHETVYRPLQQLLSRRMAIDCAAMG